MHYLTCFLLSYSLILVIKTRISVISNYREPGELKVETATAKEGEGSEFIIKLPLLPTSYSYYYPKKQLFIAESSENDIFLL